jgi:ketosteroid isomerase-like protein
VRRAYHFAEGAVLHARGFTGLFAEDGVFTGIGSRSGPESYRGEHLGDVVVLMGKFLPDGHRELHRVNVLGDVVAVELSIRGIFLGPSETPAGVIEPTGPSSTSVWYVRDGKIQESTAVSGWPPCSRSWAYCRTSPPQPPRPHPHDNADKSGGNP